MRTLLFRNVYYEGISKLPEDRQLEAYNAIMKYGFTGEIMEYSGECAPVLAMIFHSIDADIDHYERRCKGGD